jgi:hypothetical protein
MSFGIRGDREVDEMGHFYRYGEKEMCLPFVLGANGQTKFDTAKQGFGILLFLDGQPQPYRVGADGELTYFHVFYPDFNLIKPSNEEVIYDLYITPVTGEKGDMLELWATTISYPHWQTSDPSTGWKYTFGGIQFGTRVKMDATPKAEKPDIAERIGDVDISYVDTTFQEVGDWSDQELIERYAYTWFVNDWQPKPGEAYYYNFTPSDSVELRFEIWGTPYVRYGLMFYIDNQPISAQQEIVFDMQSGKKTIVTITLNLSDFDGECVVYAALIPRNAKTPENFNTVSFLDMSKAYFLVEYPNPVG